MAEIEKTLDENDKLLDDTAIFIQKNFLGELK